MTQNGERRRHPKSHSLLILIIVSAGRGPRTERSSLGIAQEVYWTNNFTWLQDKYVLTIGRIYKQRTPSEETQNLWSDVYSVDHAWLLALAFNCTAAGREDEELEAWSSSPSPLPLSFRYRRNPPRFIFYSGRSYSLIMCWHQNAQKPEIWVCVPGLLGNKNWTCLTW